MTIDTEGREAFEKVFRAEGSYDLSRDHEGDYSKPDTWEAYQGWQAAMEYRGIQWLVDNKLHGCQTGDCPHDYQSECDEALAPYLRTAPTASPLPLDDLRKVRELLKRSITSYDLNTYSQTHLKNALALLDTIIAKQTAGKGEG
jgi:hypothetical protein